MTRTPRQVRLSLRSSADPVAPKWRIIADLASSEIPAKIEWSQDGVLSGSPEAMLAVDTLINTGIELGITPTGPYVKADKRDELSAFAMGRYIFQGAIDVTGDPPDLGLEELPEGAVA